MKREKKNYFRLVFGFVITAIGLATLVSGLLITHNDKGNVHWSHIILSFILLFIGGYLMSPATAEALADAIIKRLPAVWPGGKRASDPPAQPGVPLPPSVTGERPSRNDIEGA